MVLLDKLKMSEIYVFSGNKKKLYARYHFACMTINVLNAFARASPVFVALLMARSTSIHSLLYLCTSVTG